MYGVFIGYFLSTLVRTFFICFTSGDNCVKWHIKDGVAVVRFDTPDSKVILVCCNAG